VNDDDLSDVRFEITQGTLLWPQSNFGSKRRTLSDTTLSLCAGIPQTVGILPSVLHKRINSGDVGAT